MKIRGIKDQFLPVFLVNNSSSNYTQVWTTLLSDCERVSWFIFGHASVSLTLNVQIASDSSGTGATSLFTDVTTLASGKVQVFTIDAGQLTSAKQYVSLLATRGAGTYSVLRIKYALHNEGNLTQDSSVLAITELLT